MALKSAEYVSYWARFVRIRELRVFALLNVFRVVGGVYAVSVSTGAFGLALYVAQ